MPIVVNRDDQQRRVTVTVSDPWSVEEVAIASERQIAEQTWRYGTLYDLRGSTWVPSEPDMQWLAQRGQQLAARHGARGPVAVLVDASASELLAQRYAQYGRLRGDQDAIQIFRNEADALRWFSAQPVAG